MTNKEIINREKQKEISSDAEIIKAGKEDGKTITEAIKSNPSLANNFSKTGSEVVKDIESTQKIDNLVNAVNNNPELKDPENKNIIQNFVNSLKSGNTSEAFTALFGFLQGVMGPGQSPESTFWFKDNKEINEFLTRLATNKDKVSLTELESQKKNLFNKIESINGVKKKLGLTYAVSCLLDEIVIKKDPNKKSIMGKGSSKSPNLTNQHAIARMAQQVKPGDVLAVNKSEQKFGDKLLTNFSNDDIDTSHVLIVTAVNPESGKITVAHSTGSKVNSSGKGVETNLDFEQYTAQFNEISIAALHPPEENVTQLLQNVLAKDGKGYDEGAAASTALLGSNLTRNNDKYNCVELIAQSFSDNVSNKRKDRTHPSQMLETLQPVYVTIAGKSIGGS